MVESAVDPVVRLRKYLEAGVLSLPRRYRRVRRVLDPTELAEHVEDIERRLKDAALPERKAVTQAVVAEIKVRDRGPHPAGLPRADFSTTV